MASLSPSLGRLFKEIDARWPSRDRRTDGWYRSPSVGISVGHNPGERGLVHAIDVDKDGIRPLWIIDNIYRGGGVLFYIIWDRRVWSTRTGWDGHHYTGSNPHTDHMHIEIYQTVTAEQFSKGWGIAPATSGFGEAPSSGFGAAVDFDPTPTMDSLANRLQSLGSQAYGGASMVRDLRKR